jgi:hypothetical protein
MLSSRSKREVAEGRGASHSTCWRRGHWLSSCQRMRAEGAAGSDCHRTASKRLPPSGWHQWSAMQCMAYLPPWTRRLWSVADRVLRGRSVTDQCASRPNRKGTALTALGGVQVPKASQQKGQWT